MGHWLDENLDIMTTLSPWPGLWLAHMPGTSWKGNARRARKRKGTAVGVKVSLLVTPTMAITITSRVAASLAEDREVGEEAPAAATAAVTATAAGAGTEDIITIDEDFPNLNIVG